MGRPHCRGMRTLASIATVIVMATSGGWQHTVAATEGEREPLLASRTALHVGIVVSDIDAAVTHWTALLELDAKPEIFLATGHHSRPTHFKGHPTDAEAKLAFFQLENIQIELIQPMGDHASDWRDFLMATGGGVHHLAFNVSGLRKQQTPKLDSEGYPVLQEGGWDGGEYVYLDSADKLGVTLELLETYAKGGGND